MRCGWLGRGGPPISLARCLTRWSSAPEEELHHPGASPQVCGRVASAPHGTRIHHPVPGMLRWGEAAEGLEEICSSVSTEETEEAGTRAAKIKSVDSAARPICV